MTELTERDTDPDAASARSYPLEFHAAPVPRSEPDRRTWLPEPRERMARQAALGRS